MSSAISTSLRSGASAGVTISKISSVSRAAARMRSTSTADFRPRSAPTIASEDWKRSVNGVSSKIAWSSSQRPCVRPSAAASLAE
jgi:hypothetical protein